MEKAVLPEFADAGFVARDNEHRSRLARAWELHVKEYPPGSLNLPPLLEERRLEYKLAAGFFKYARIWDYVLVAQITYQEKEDELISGTGLVRPKAYEDAEIRQSYLGVLVSAGSTALDKLESEGVTLGHIVCFLRHTPWHAKVDTLELPGGGYEPIHGIDLVAGDIRGSLDLGAAMASGECSRKVRKHADGGNHHVYMDKNGDEWAPQTPVMMEKW